MFHFSRNSIYVFGLSIHYYGILIALGVLLGVLLGTRLGENTLRACFGVLILLLAARELWLGVQAIRRDGWRFRAC